MVSIEYDLSSINGIKIENLLEKNNIDNMNHLIHKQWVKNEKIYDIIKYDKSLLSYDMIKTIGKFRSVIFSNKKLLSFSPPKSLNSSIFMDRYKESECIAEEFIEGTMINLFYDYDINKWEIASKSSVGGNITFFKDQPIFSKLFEDICSENNINLNNFDKQYCYSFVIQHPQNRFVIPIKEKKLYLIACYKIDKENYKIIEVPKYNLNMENIILPQVSYFTSYSELTNIFASMNTDPNIMGVVIYHKDGIRTKLRNPNYEYIKQLRGNNSKLQYQYLCLRKLDKVKDYLKYFPENRKQLHVFRKQIHKFTENLHSNYIQCYIKKEKLLKEFPPQFRIHMYNLHQKYLELREYGGYINKTIVIEYINNLDSAKLMYSLNYHMRKIIEHDALIKGPSPFYSNSGSND